MNKWFVMVFGLVVVVSFAGVADAVESKESMAASLASAVSQLPGAGSPEAVIESSPPATDPDLKWTTPDIVVTDGSSDQGSPSVAAAPSGELFMAVNVIHASGIRIYHSTDGGQNWSWLAGLNHGTETRNPALVYAENGGVRWLVVVYERVGADAERGLHAARFNADDPANDYLFTSIEASITWLDPTTQLYPQITCDFPEFSSGVYFYVTWAKPSIDHYPVFFSRSTDQAVTWESPLDITGGSENTSVETRPEIAYSAHRNAVYVAFNKPGWTGSEWAPQVWVINNTSWGGPSSWLPPVQVTDSSLDDIHPSVAAAWDSDTVMVAWERVYSADDSDVKASYSVDGGAGWSSQVSLPWTFVKEDSVDLAVSQSASGRFHAAYRHHDPAIVSGGNIWYSWTAVSTPGVWSSALDVDDGSNTSGLDSHPRPSICVDFSQAPEDEAALAWTKWSPSYNALFDSALLSDFAGIFADDFESGDVSEWSSSVP